MASDEGTDGLFRALASFGAKALDVLRAWFLRTKTQEHQKLDAAKKLTKLMLKHRRVKITPTQFQAYRDLMGFGWRRQEHARADIEAGAEDNPVTGLFFDYGVVISASIDREDPDDG